jgi:SAM-dependent methyltransferase
MTRVSDTRRRCPWCRLSGGRRVWVEDGYAYVRCGSCGGVFADLRVDEYEGARHNVWDESGTTADVLGFYGDARAQPHAEFLRRFPVRGAGRLLDVGCGLGFFLESARTAGWDVYGCDTSPDWVDAANGRLDGKRVVCGAVDADTFGDRRFDLITAWDVLEHVFDPVPFLSAIRDLLAPGGVVFLRTPNIRYVLPVYRLRRRLGHDVELGPTNHVVYFDSSSIRRALDAAGLRATGWPAFSPPQVATFAAEDADRYAPRASVAVGVKNVYARTCRGLAWATRGRAYFASDLDVVAIRA